MGVLDKEGKYSVFSVNLQLVFNVLDSYGKYSVFFSGFIGFFLPDPEDGLDHCGSLREIQCIFQ